MYEAHILTAEEGKELLKIARTTLDKFVRGEHAAKAGEYSDKFHQKFGVICTLWKNNEMRGQFIAGLPYPILSIIDAATNAVIASSHEDKRFHAVMADELNEIKIEISLFTEPIYISVKSNLDFLKQIMPRVDGLILRYGPYESFLMPEAWDTLKEKEDFIAHLCTMAGLEKDAWRESDIELYKFQSQVFRE